MRDMLGQLKKAHVEKVCQHLGATCGEGQMSQANLVLGHFRYEQIEQIVHSRGKAADFPDKQVVVFISAALQKYAYVEPNINRVVEVNGKKRALLFVRRMNLLANDAVMKDVLSLSFEQVEKIVEEGNARSLGWSDDPFSESSLPIFEVLPALFILCQTYLAQLSKAKGNADKDEPQPPRAPEDMEAINALGEWSKDAKAGEGQKYRPDQPEWWRVFEGVALEADAKREWDLLDAQAAKDPDYGWKELNVLREAIEPGQTVPITTEMVAQAYAAIVRRFGQ